MTAETKATIFPTLIQAHTVVIVTAGVYLNWHLWFIGFCLLPLFLAMHFAARTAFISGGTAELKRINKRWEARS